ncbi:hypothetical protein KGP93_34170, partial [Burkholderia multivorans]|nr:hypothetical protein [Burkholderia multivorans]
TARRTKLKRDMRLSFGMRVLRRRADYRRFARSGSELILRSYRRRFSFAFHALSNAIDDRAAISARRYVVTTGPKPTAEAVDGILSVLSHADTDATHHMYITQSLTRSSQCHRAAEQHNSMRDPRNYIWMALFN